MLTWAAWGLILDIAGVLIIATAAIQTGVESGYLVMRRAISHPKIVFTAKLLGWALLVVGFGLQLVAELTP